MKRMKKDVRDTKREVKGVKRIKIKKKMKIIIAKTKKELKKIKKKGKQKNIVTVALGRE